MAKAKNNITNKPYKNTSNIPIIFVSNNVMKALDKAIDSAVKLIFGRNKRNVPNSNNIVHPDIVRVTSETSIGIELIKQVNDHISRKPFQAERIAVVIHPGDAMTAEAQNALLKTLEDTPKHAQIFITTQHLSSILPTVRSRCKVVEVYSEKDYASVLFSLQQIQKADSSIRLDIAKKIADKYAKDVKGLEELFDQWILNVRAKEPQVLEVLVMAKKMLKANVTIPHVLDYVVINLE